MNIAAEVRKSYAKHPKAVKLDDLKVVFKFPDDIEAEQDPNSPEMKARIAASKAHWKTIRENKKTLPKKKQPKQKGRPVPTPSGKRRGVDPRKKK